MTQENTTPLTFVQSTVPAKASHNRSASATQYAHNEQTEPHRDTVAECMRPYVTHVSNVGVEPLLNLRSWMRVDTSSVQHKDDKRRSANGQREAQPEGVEGHILPLYTAGSSLLVG